MNTDTFLNQVLLEIIDFAFQFMQIRKQNLKNLKLEDITYQKS